MVIQNGEGNSVRALLNMLRRKSLLKIVLEYEGIGILLASDSRDTLDYLDSFLSPFFQQKAYGQVAVAFEIFVSFNESFPLPLSEMGKKNGKDILLRDATTEQGRFKGEYWLIDEVQVVKTKDTRTYFLFEKSCNQAYVVAQSFEGMKRDARLLIRDVVQRHTQNNKGIFFHASAAVNKHSNKVVAILGDKGAGKTTLLFQYLMRGGTYSALSFDRLVLYEQEDVLTAVGWPTLITIGIGTLLRHPRLLPLVPKNHYVHSVSKREKSEKTIALLEEKVDKLTLESSDIPWLNISRKAPLGCILFSHRSSLHEDTTIDRMSQRDILAALSKSCYSPDDPNFIDWHKLVDSKTCCIANRAQVLINKIARDVPCFNLQWGQRIQLVSP